MSRKSLENASKKSLENATKVIFRAMRDVKSYLLLETENRTGGNHSQSNS